MKLESSTVLVTGGASGIGLALAERFLASGSRVIVCGRREDKLRAAREKLPGLATRVCDIVEGARREEFARSITAEFPKLNVVVNNAGVQRRIALADQNEWEAIHQEIAINLEAPIHLSMRLIPHLRERADSAIVNITSGLAFSPLASVPVYCATKAALHSFTLSLRRQLAGTSIRVVEIAPPAVDTDLGGPGLHRFGVPVDELADAVFPRMKEGELEIAYGFAQESSRASREQLDAIFERMNSPGR